MKNNIAVMILAAGKGVRMRSDTPKVLHKICGRPMLDYVLDLARDLKFKKTVIVLGHRHQEVKKFIKPPVRITIQKKLLGTADAAKTALNSLKGFKGTVLVLYGDIPLLKKETIKGLLKYHQENMMDATVLTSRLEAPSGYGRILRDKYAGVCGIKEEKDADDFEKDIKEINTGIICFDKDKLYSALSQVRPNNRKKEYYLTDIISIFYKKGYLVGGYRLADAVEALGINSRRDLARVNRIMQKRINEGLMEKGVALVAPEFTFISYGTKIGPDTVIYPFTVIEGNVKIGKHCQIGPFAHLREGTVISDGALVGNFVETARTAISSRTLAKHFCYLGDSRIGKDSNIGAGTVTANFDGRNKHITRIGDKVFIGSDTVLVAPVEVARGAKTGAGSVIIKNVSSGTTVVGVPAKPLKSV
ncbi:MAG: NTP transferase domain-containing protein [Candidatus Omnitrophica bacterium]|nr:NTP transferase domain-containing protein [Candidatus Omnitrophota bacterium]